jgi:hypothetical protein
MTTVIASAKVDFDDDCHRIPDEEDSQMSAEVGSPITTYFRVCDGVRVRFADNKAESDVTVLLLAA